jgi:type IV pilus assembly protein PilZ
VIEHRQQQRYDRRISVEWAEGDNWRTALTRNMSIGGIYIESSEKMTLGKKLKLRFRVPTQKEPIEVGAQVRWSDASGFGAQFDGLRARDVWALGKFLEQPG